MRVSKLPHVIAALAVSVAAAAVLSGCAALPYLASLPLDLPGTTSSTTPAVGSCWNTTFEVAARAADWTASSPIPCAQDHQLITFAVATVASTASSWADSSGDLLNAVANAANDACGAARRTALPDAPEAGRFMYFFFVPSVSQWKAGARWARCDAAVLTVGSPESSPSLDPLPTSANALDALIVAHPLAYDDCISTSDPSGAAGPLDDPAATIADCSAQYQWMFHDHFTFTEGAGAAFPSESEISDVETSQCGSAAASANRSWIAYPPTASQWAGGYRGGACWFYRDASLG